MSKHSCLFWRFTFPVVAAFWAACGSEKQDDISNIDKPGQMSRSVVTAGTYPYSVALTPSGQFAYVANYGSSTVSAYTVGANGALSRIGTDVSTGPVPVGLAVHSSGRFVYVSNSNESSDRLPGSITIFSVNESTGALTRTGPDVPTGTIWPRMIAVHPSGQYLYVGNAVSNNISAYSIDSTTGALSAIQGSPFASGENPYGVVIHRSGQFAYAANDSVNTISAFTINQANGSLARIGDLATGTGPLGVAVHPTRPFLYVANWSANSVSLYTINETTGALARNGPDVPSGTNAIRVVVHPSGRYLYVTNNGSNNISAFSIDQTTGTLSPLSGSPFVSGTNPVGMAIDPSGRFAYATSKSNTVSEYSIQPDGRLVPLVSNPSDETCSASELHSTTGACSGPWQYKRYRTLQCHTACPRDSCRDTATCYRRYGCRHADHGIERIYTVNPPNTVPVREEGTAELMPPDPPDLPHPYWVYTPTTTCYQAALDHLGGQGVIDHQYVGICNCGAPIRIDGGRYYSNCVTNFPSHTDGDGLPSNRVYYYRDRFTNPPDGSSSCPIDPGSGYTCWAVPEHYTNCPRLDDCPLESTPDPCGYTDRDNYSAPGLTLAQLGLQDPLALTSSLADGDRPLCLTDDMRDVVSAADVQAKEDVLFNLQTRIITGSPAFPTAIDRESLLQNVVTKRKLLYELKGDQLLPQQRDRVLGLYETFPSYQRNCGGWQAPRVDESCPALSGISALNATMNLCSRLTEGHVRREILGASGVSTNIVDTCIEAMTRISPLSDDRCQGQAYRSQYAAFSPKLLSKDMELIRRQGDQFVNADFQPYLARIGRWYGLLRPALYPIPGESPPDDFWNDLSGVMRALWKQAFIAANLSTSAQPALDTIEVNRAVLEAALTNYSGSGNQPPLTKSPLLMMVGDVSRSISERLNHLGIFHNTACIFIHCSHGAKDSMTSELWRLLAAIPDAGELKAKLIATTHLQPEWKRAFTRLSDTQKFDIGQIGIFEDAVLDARSLTGSYNPTLITAAAPQDITPPIAELVRAVNEGRLRVRNYDNGGTFDLLPGRVLEGGVNESARDGYLAIINERLNRLHGDIAAYQALQQQLVHNLIEEMQGEATQTHLENDMERTLTQMGHYVENIDGLRHNIEVTNARYADFGKAFNTAAAWESDEGFRITRESHAYVIDAVAGARFDPREGRSRITQISQLQLEINRLRDPVTGELESTEGQMLNVRTTGSWSPTCTLSRASVFDHQLTHAEVNNAMTGPEGFTYNQSTGTVTANQHAHTDSEYTDFHVNQSFCAGGSFSWYAFFIRGETCTGWDYISSTTDATTTTESAESRSSAAFTKGLRLGATPFPQFPVGSLLLVEMDKGETEIPLHLRNVHVLQNPYTTVHLVADVDIYFVVNDMRDGGGQNCIPSDTPGSLSAETTRVVPFGQYAKRLGQAMAHVFAGIQTRMQDYVNQGQVTTSDIALIRSGAYSDIGTEFPIDNYPPLLKSLFETYLAKEVAILEKKVLVRQNERGYALSLLDFKTQADDYQSARLQSRYRTLLPAWTLEALDNIQLGEAAAGIGSLVVRYLYPILEIRYPETLIPLANNAALNDLIQLDWRSPIDSPNVVSKVENAITAVKQQLQTAAADPTRISVEPVVLAYPRPCPGDDPGGDPGYLSDDCITYRENRTNYSTGNVAAPERSRAVWRQAVAGNLVSLTVDPNDLYRAVGGRAVLLCNEASPVISYAGLFVRRQGGVGHTDDTFRLTTQINPNVTFVTSDGIKTYAISKADWLTDSFRILYSDATTPWDAVQRFTRIDAGLRSTGKGWSPFSTFDMNFAPIIANGNPLQTAVEMDLVLFLEKRDTAPLHFQSSCP